MLISKKTKSLKNDSLLKVKDKITGIFTGIYNDSQKRSTALINNAAFK